MIFLGIKVEDFSSLKSIFYLNASSKCDNWKKSPSNSMILSHNYGERGKSSVERLRKKLKSQQKKLCRTTLT